MLALIQNEWMKLWRKKAAWIMLGLLVFIMVGSTGLSKWTMEKFATKEEQTWQQQQEAIITDADMQLAVPDLPKSEKERVEKNKAFAQYHLDKNVAPYKADSSETHLLNSYGLLSLVTLFTVIISAGIVASEFSQGTIKMLVSRPVSRWKILLSKYVTVLLYGVLMTLVTWVVTLGAGWIFYESSNGMLLDWKNNQVVEVSIWAKSLYLYLLAFVGVCTTGTFAFMIGSVFRSSSLAIGLSIFLMFTGNTIVAFFSKYEFVKYLVFTHDLTQYESGYMLIEGITMQFSIAVIAAYIVLFLVISFLSFTKRDITA